MKTKADLQERFQRNLDRVRSLISLYSSLAGTGKGRASVEATDTLRAAVVLIHASMEDLLRSVARIRLPAAKPEVLADIPLVDSKDSRQTRFGLKELSSFRGSTVEQVLAKSIDAFLERRSFNNLGEIVKLLEDIGLNPPLADADKSELAAMMRRRHLIAHRVDWNERTGRGHHRALSLGRSVVETWATTVERFGTAILSKL